MDYSLQGSSVHGISQSRILEWVALSFSSGSSQPRDWTHVSCIGRWILHHWTTREAHLFSLGSFKTNWFPLPKTALRYIKNNTYDLNHLWTLSSSSPIPYIVLHMAWILQQQQKNHDVYLLLETLLFVDTQNKMKLYHCYGPGPSVPTERTKHTFRRRQWHPTPVLLPGKSHGQRSLIGYSPWGR